MSYDIGYMIFSLSMSGLTFPFRVLGANEHSVVIANVTSKQHRRRFRQGKASNVNHRVIATQVVDHDQIG